MHPEGKKPKTLFEDEQALNNFVLAMGNLFSEQAGNFNREAIPNQQHKATTNKPNTEGETQSNNLENLEAKQFQFMKQIHTTFHSKLSTEDIVKLYNIILSEDSNPKENYDNNFSSIFEVTEDGNITQTNGRNTTRNTTSAKQAETNTFYNSKWSIWDKLYFFLVQSDDPLRVADLVEKILIQEDIDTDNAELVRKINVNVNATLSSKFLNGDNIINRQKIRGEYHYSLVDKDIIATKNV